MEIRKGIPADIDELSVLYDDLDYRDIIIENDITVDEFCRIRESVGFQSLSYSQARKVLNNTSYIAVARYQTVCVGITRLLFDYGTDAYITDVIVDPVFQGRGIGKLLIQSVLDHIKENTVETQVVISLYANAGKEPFYEKFGFNRLPSQKYGYGMVLDV